jgi:hypothetical protein
MEDRRIILALSINTLRAAIACTLLSFPIHWSPANAQNAERPDSAHEAGAQSRAGVLAGEERAQAAKALLAREKAFQAGNREQALEFIREQIERERRSGLFVDLPE